MENIDYFPEIIGQSQAKSQLTLNLEGYYTNKFLPPILLVAPRGFGKSKILGVLAKRLGKPYIIINCASIRNLDQFVSQLIIPYQNKEITYLFDECHNIPKLVTNWLLNVICPNQERKSFNHHNNVRYDFDFCQTSFVSATTNPETLSEAYKSRHERVDLEEYSTNELVNILLNHTPNINYLDSTHLDIVSVCRSTPREIVKLSDKIKQYSDIKKYTKFDNHDWKELKKRAGINHLGLTHHEIKVLKSLKECGELSLGMLASKLRLDRTTVMRDIETFLHEKSLINIEGKRYLTKAGQEVLENMEKS